MSDMIYYGQAEPAHQGTVLKIVPVDSNAVAMSPTSVCLTSGRNML